MKTTEQEALDALEALVNADFAIQEGIGLKSDQAMCRIAALDFAERVLSNIAGRRKTS